MRLYNATSCTPINAGTTKQYIPKSYVPRSTRFGWYNVHSKVFGKQSVRRSLDSCLHTRDTASISSIESFEGPTVDNSVTAYNGFHSIPRKARLGCQSPLPTKQATVNCLHHRIDTAETASTSTDFSCDDALACFSADQFHFDIQDTMSHITPISSANINCHANIDLKRSSSPRSFMHYGGYPKSLSSLEYIRAKGHQSLFKNKPDDCSHYSASTLSSVSASDFRKRTTFAQTNDGRYHREHFTMKDFTNRNSSDPPSPYPVERYQTSSRDMAAFAKLITKTATASDYKYVGTDHQASLGLPRAPQYETSYWTPFPTPFPSSNAHPFDKNFSREATPTQTPLVQCPQSDKGENVFISQSRADEMRFFEAAFQNTEADESVMVTIHRKDHLAGLSTMRSYFRDEKGHWSKLVPINSNATRLPMQSMRLPRKTSIS